MKKIWGFVLWLFAFLSCEPVHHVERSSSSTPKPNNTSKPITSPDSDSYDELIKTYKPETAEVLNDLLNDNYDPQRTSVMIDNKSNCNMVITIKGGGLEKKIPVGKQKLGHAMVNRNQQYTISGKVCGKNYRSTKYITDSYTITLK